MNVNSKDLRKLQFCQLKILKEVHRICVKNNIKYFLSDGTLIGAVRHHGFIPWDDDLDIGMLREEYEKFCEICKTDLSDDYFFQTIDTDNCYANPFGKMLLNGTVFIEANAEKSNKVTGVNIDIFPYDYIPNEKYKQKIHDKFARLLKNSYWTKKKYRAIEKFTLKLFFHYIIYRTISLFPVILIKNTWLNILKKYLYLSNNDNCLVTKFGGNYFNNRTLKSNLNEVILLNFEDEMFYVPKEYDTVLTGLYGNYMELPPVEKRIPQHNLVEYKF